MIIIYILLLCIFKSNSEEFGAQTNTCCSVSYVNTTERFALLTLSPSGQEELLQLSCGRHSQYMNTVKLTAPLGPENGD